jgi:hypothetical protein
VTHLTDELSRSSTRVVVNIADIDRMVSTLKDQPVVPFSQEENTST